MPAPPEGPIRWYADESVLGLGKRLAAARPDVTYCGHPSAAGIRLGFTDEEWMPVVAAQGWIAFRRDRRIHTRPDEVKVFAAAGLRTIWLGGKKDMSGDQQLELVLNHWPGSRSGAQNSGWGPGASR